MSTLSTVAEWAKVLVPLAVDLAEEIAHAGDDLDKLYEARMRHDRRVSDAIMRSRLDLPEEP